MEITIGPGSRVVSYQRRDLREDAGPQPSYGAVVNPDEGQSLVAFDDGEIERVENATLLPEGGCPLCGKLNISEAKFCGGCGVELNEQALLQYEEANGIVQEGGLDKAAKGKFKAYAKPSGEMKKTDEDVIPESIGTTPSGKTILPFEHDMYRSNEAFFEATSDWTPADHKAAASVHFHQGLGCNELAGQAHEQRVVEMGGSMSAADPIAEVGR